MVIISERVRRNTKNWEKSSLQNMFAKLNVEGVKYRCVGAYGPDSNNTKEER